MEKTGSFPQYLLGLILSLFLTLAAYIIASQHRFSPPVVKATVVALGTIQALVQLRLFLNLGKESSPRWNLWTFLFMLLVIVIVVAGSLWIMYSLDYRLMGK